MPKTLVFLFYFIYLISSTSALARNKELDRPFILAMDSGITFLQEATYELTDTTNNEQHMIYDIKASGWGYGFSLSYHFSRYFRMTLRHLILTTEDTQEADYVLSGENYGYVDVTLNNSYTHIDVDFLYPMNKWWSWSIGGNLGRQSTKVESIEYNDNSSELSKGAKKDQAGLAYGFQTGIQTAIDNLAISAQLKHVINSQDNAWAETTPGTTATTFNFEQETPSFFIFIISIGLRF